MVDSRTATLNYEFCLVFAYQLYCPKQLPVWLMKFHNSTACLSMITIPTVPRNSVVSNRSRAGNSFSISGYAKSNKFVI